ncbi:conserved hypothetical protein [Burkholderia pseudomallei MSHR346]|nr:conserved hypothetical protein [Burkholderia pseudomallei MSHR346]KGS17469.1 hypothetical protein X989_5275 [Burkholderia pseudomallei MSHR4378]
MARPPYRRINESANAMDRMPTEPPGRIRPFESLHPDTGRHAPATTNDKDGDFPS